MKLKDYRLTNWKENRIKRQKRIADKYVLLLSIDRTLAPPKEGRKNLLAVDKDDNILWIAELPTKINDSYVEMKYLDGVIKAESSNSFISEIDPDNGKIIKKYMAK